MVALQHDEPEMTRMSINSPSMLLVMSPLHMTGTAGTDLESLFE